MAKTYHNLDIDWKLGCFYQYSKEDQPGFKKHTNTAGTVSYRKYYKSGIYGILQSISVVDTNLGKKLALRMMDGDDIYIAKVSLYDQRGNIDNNFAEPLITLLPNLEKNQAYRLFPWIMEDEERKTKKGNPKRIYGFSIKKADLDNKKVLEGDENIVEPRYLRRKKDEEFNADIHLPDLDFVEELGSYKPTAISLDERRRFLINILEEADKVLGYHPDGEKDTPSKDVPQEAFTKPQVEKKEQKQPTTQVEFDEDDYDDLPF